MEKHIGLLKLGGRKHLGEERWRGALELFDDIYCACLYREDSMAVDDSRVHMIELKENKINFFLTGVLLRTRFYKSLYVINWILVFLLRLFNVGWIKKLLSLEYDKVLCSYGDYDRSDLVFLIAKPAVKKPVVRSYKETRPGYNFLEVEAMKKADKIVLYDVEIKKFLENKYGASLFEKKNILIGYDENALPNCILQGIRYDHKLSELDGKVHIVILTYRADSDPNRDRDWGRYYYVEVIRQLLDAGLVVHLHCAQYNNSNGVNEYEKLQNQYAGQFYMEPALDMKRTSTADEWIKSCEILSRYDIGLLHNIKEGTKVSEFDRINIPHRFFAYEAAHVTPIIKRGENIVLERMFKEDNYGLIYDDFSDLTYLNTGRNEVNYYTPSYEEYLAKALDI